MTGRIREVLFDDGVDASGTAIEAASKAYVDAKSDPVEPSDLGIWLDNTSGLPTLSPWRAGVIAWDTQNKCLAVSTSYDGSWMQVGQEMTDDAVNKTGDALTNGTVVYFEGSQGNRPKMWKAYCTDDDLSNKTIGLVTQDAGIADNAEGPVTTSGVVRNLNTNAFTEGDLLWLDTVAGQYTKTRPSYQYNHIMIGIVIKAHLTHGEIYVSIKNLTDPLAKAGFHIVDPHGFTEYDDTYMTRSWVGNTFTLTQVGTSTPYFCKGRQKYLTGNKSITVTPTLGAHFIGLNCDTEVLEDLGGTIPAASVVSTHIICEFCYADGTNVIYKANERHSTKFLKKDWFYKHLYLSTQYRSGLQPSITSIDGNGSSDTHAQFSTTSGLIADEDIEVAIASKAATDLKALWYYDGTKWVTASGSTGSGVLPAGTGRAAYNNIASGLVECTDNHHVLTHLFAANDGTLIGIVGNAEYQLIAAARLAASTEIATLITTGLPFPEFRAIATFINKTKDTYSNATKSIIVSVDTGVSFIDWRRTALNPVAGQSASNHQNLSGLQGGQAAEYYHLTAAQNTNIVNNVFPSGTSTNSTNKIFLPTNTTAGWNALTPTETLVGWDSSKKKPVVGNGTAIIPIGGGLTVTNITVSGTTPTIATLESGKHYVYNGAGASGDVTITMPAVAAESNIRVTVYNIPTTRKLILARAGSDNFRKDDTLYTTVEFVAVEVEQSSEFMAATDAAEWLVNDGSNALGTVWGGALTVTGPFTPSGGIVGRTDGVAVAAGYVGERINGTASSFTAQTDNFAKNASSIVLDKGIYDLYAVGVVSRSAGLTSIASVGLSITTTSGENPLLIATMRAGRSIAVVGSGLGLLIGPAAAQSIFHSLGGVNVSSGSTTYYCVLNDNGATYDGDATFYAIRRG